MPVAEKTDRNGRQLLDITSILFTQNRLIFIDELITDTLASEVTKQLLYLSTVGDEDITLVINSPGGSVTAGMAIYDTMKGLNCDVSTICLGMAASMAALPACRRHKGKTVCDAKQRNHDPSGYGRCPGTGCGCPDRSTPHWSYEGQT